MTALVNNKIRDLVPLTREIDQVMTTSKAVLAWSQPFCLL